MPTVVSRCDVRSLMTRIALASFGTVIAYNPTEVAIELIFCA